jgi:hypothetical protein
MTPEEHRIWRTQRIREGQRSRRAGLRRIDYQDVSKAAATVIDAECGAFPGGDYSSTLNRIVCEWAELRADAPQRQRD